MVFIMVEGSEDMHHYIMINKIDVLVTVNDV